MPRLSISINFNLNIYQIKNMILFMLIDDKSYPHKINKERVIIKLEQLLICYGIDFLKEDNIKSKYSYLKNFDDLNKKADFLVYELFPELSEEENSIKFIKSIGD